MPGLPRSTDPGRQVGRGGGKGQGDFFWQAVNRRKSPRAIDPQTTYDDGNSGFRLRILKRHCVLRKRRVQINLRRLDGCDCQCSIPFSILCAHFAQRLTRPDSAAINAHRIGRRRDIRNNGFGHRHRAAIAIVYAEARLSVRRSRRCVELRIRHDQAAVLASQAGIQIWIGVLL